MSRMSCLLPSKCKKVSFFPRWWAWPLTFKFIRDIVIVNPSTKFWVHTSNGSVGRELTNWHADRWTDGTDFILLTADCYYFWSEFHQSMDDTMCHMSCLPQIIIMALWHHKLWHKHQKVLEPPICILLLFKWNWWEHKVRWTIHDIFIHINSFPKIQ